MKQSFAFGFVAVLCAAIALSCSKPESHAPEMGAGGLPLDPTTDLVACTNPVEHILYVLPEQNEKVLKQLNAKTSNGELYSMSAIAANGRATTFSFQVRTATLGQILFQAGEQDLIRQLLDIYDAEAERDTARGRFIGKLDTGGVFYRVYINAMCGSSSKGYETSCMKERMLIDEPDSTSHYVETGKYIQFKHYDINHCFKGTGSCIEALVIRTERRVYNGPGCGGAPLSNTVVSREYSCVN